MQPFTVAAIVQVAVYATTGQVVLSTFYAVPVVLCAFVAPARALLDASRVVPLILCR
ncbi:hypothetical protein [Leucobacter komagatae]|uniref:hypothetical protein n=1 Tax=Leucobacter komagatae TaxID=55969 RepID=UPI0012EE7BBA|nr:hypothetical protein [Leucobacter komagatae]